MTRRKPNAKLMEMVLRAIAKAPTENWSDANLRVLVWEMQHGARMALRGTRR